MARRKTVKKTSKKRSSSRKAPAKKAEPIERGPHPLGPLMRQTIAILFVLGSMFSGLNSVEAAVHDDEAYRMKADSLTLGETPAWMLPADELRRSLDLPFGDISIFDESLEARVRQALENAPWVREVHEVSKILPHDLNVSFEPRRPVARVRQGFRHLLVDVDGVLLPDDVYTQTEGLPFLDGIKVDVPSVGRKMNDPVLKRALGLMKAWHESGLLDRYPDMKIMKVTCASPREIASGEPEFVVAIPRRVRLYFDAGDEEGELSYTDALKNFEKILFRDPHLSHIKDRIDLRWKRPALR